MSHLEFLQSRQSVSVRHMGEGVPSAEELQQIFQSAMSAPDHGALRPWRFLTLDKDAMVKLGDLFVEGLLARDPEASDEAQEMIRGKAQRTSLLIVAAAEITEGHPKVPPIEQIVASSAATQNVLLALHGLGYGAVLVTGPNAHSPQVKAGLGFAEKDEILGFILVGSIEEEQREKKRADAQGYYKAWKG
ncbi:nitroreductase family protein [Rhodovibrionaceae bacterium A322]